MLSLVARYAKSLFDKSKEENKVDQIFKEFSDFVNLLQKEKIIWKLWTSMSISISDKENLILKKINLSTVLYNFLKILLKKKRQNLIFKINYYYKKIYNREKNIMEIEMVVPFKIEDQFFQEIIKTLENKLNKNIVIKKVTINPEIIGGLILIEEDIIIDLSLKKDFDKLIKDIERTIDSKINQLNITGGKK